ncbi:efflux RND transporter periplasmic adaptor subunit [Natronogracilivirga saccharolytica]|uniref:Efflux RND transporter periplasmic adaptor subunit n=1 Tax=Natronogracilivirga saccharolytica TaxID=2812953 RepID=A0A8J7UVP6_9BACT|nr:efflux RND transporter periplasmic adaptor subunit [Natronogracilivirga saccharolytica]MBP3192767.1 efflux RND transporter periplasmic adaptor subunit [Natronogracilivirga saccharolytica]
MEKRTNKKKEIGAALIITAVLIAAGFIFYQNNNQENESTVLYETEEDEAVPVRTVRVNRESWHLTRTYPGNIEQWEYAFISGAAGTRILSIHAREGDKVQKGDLLAEMDRSNLNQAEVQMNTACNEVRRLENLAEAGAVSGQQLEQAQAQYDNAKSSYEQLREDTDLRAPIDGVITDKYFVEGEQFSPGGERPSLMTLMTVDPVKVTINISERYFPLIYYGMEVDVMPDTYPGETFEGEVDFIGPTVDPVSRTFRVEIRIDNPDHRLSPGMFARVRMDMDEREDLFLPAAAVHREPGNQTRYVYRVNDGTAERADVQTGDRMEEMLQIRDGLNEGDQVIQEGAGRVESGSEVRIVE